jgi:hypothetical protein
MTPEPVRRYDGDRPGILAPTLLAILLVAAVVIVVVALRSAPESSPAPSAAPYPSPALVSDASVAGSVGDTMPPATPMPGTIHEVSRDGNISHMGAGYPRSYLALPCKHGNIRCDLTVRLCGPADCVTMEQTDYGPSQRVHPDRIADVSVAVFERICGVPARYGLCPGSWTAVVALPETDQEGP